MLLEGKMDLIIIIIIIIIMSLLKNFAKKKNWCEFPREPVPRIQGQ